MWDQLAKIALQVLDNPKNKVLILRGSGQNFTAGSDIKEFNAISLEQAEEAFVHMEKPFLPLSASRFQRLASSMGLRWALAWN